MSCEVESMGVVAAVVVAAPVLATVSMGYALYESGKLLVQAGKYVQQDMQRIQQEQMAKEEQRREAARLIYDDMKDTYNRLRSEMENVQSSRTKNSLSFFMNQNLLTELMNIVVNAESMDMAKASVLTADPQIQERIRMDKELALATDRIIEALKLVKYLETEYGLCESADKWFHSCFNGIEQEIRTLLDQSTDYDVMKQGLKRLDHRMAQYYAMIPTIEEECMEFKVLYEFYTNVSKNLDEKVEKAKHFRSVKELKDRIQELKVRSKRAKLCSDIYRKLGESAYICYAWDQELKALGYQVYEENHVKELIQSEPEHGRISGKKVPFYQWSDNELMQLYTIADASELQVIVHEDGSVSMESIASGEKENAAKQIQEKHCDRMKLLHDRLKENWFLNFDYEEKETAGHISNVAEWQDRIAEIIEEGRRTHEKDTLSQMRSM